MCLCHCGDLQRLDVRKSRRADSSCEVPGSMACSPAPRGLRARHRPESRLSWTQPKGQRRQASKAGFFFWLTSRPRPQRDCRGASRHADPLRGGALLPGGFPGRQNEKHQVLCHHCGNCPKSRCQEYQLRRDVKSSREMLSSVWCGCPPQGWTLGAAERGAREVKLPAGDGRTATLPPEPTSGRCLQGKAATAVACCTAPRSPA